MDVSFVLITRATMLEELIKKYNTMEQAQFYITHLGQDFEAYRLEDRIYQEAKQIVIENLREYGRVQILDRSYLSNYIFGKDVIVVVLGQDGLVANTMKYLNHQPIIAINPNPKRWDGVLLPFQTKDLKKIIPEVIKGKRTMREITMAKAKLSDSQELYAVNDLFIGPKSHTSAGYRIDFNGEEEEQSSSGIIVSTGLGSTGWLKSIIKGAFEIVQGVSLNSTQSAELSDMEADLQKGLIRDFSWESNQLIFSVREPFVSKSSEANIVFGRIKENTPLRLRSNMPENGVIFSDGMESDYLNFSSGMQAIISVAERKGHLIV